MANSLKLAPYYYIHVLDKNSSETRLEVGPQTFIRQDNEEVVTKDPLKMVILPFRHYCKIENPVRYLWLKFQVKRDEKGNIQFKKISGKVTR